jgi:hypothetical protein
MDIEETTADEVGEVPTAPKRYKPLGSSPVWRARAVKGHSLQHATKAVHPKSLANLRPPWRKGVSGNPAGRPKRTRSRSSLRADWIGERLTTPDDYRAFYRKRLRVHEADPKTAMDATRIAALDVEACVLQQQFSQQQFHRTRKGYVCQHCGGRLFVCDEVPLFDAAGRVTWFHQHCALKEIYDRRNQARSIASKVPLSL